MNNSIHPCLWFDGQAKEAAELYCSVFPDSKITVDTPMVVNFELGGQKFMGLNGGPEFKINPSISMFVVCETEAETDNAWTHLSKDGMVLMALDKYDWSEKYGWVQDRFGMTWQISMGKITEVGQKFTPSLLFTGEQFGKAEEALKFYTSVFDHSSVAGILRNVAGDKEPEGLVKHAQFTINKYTMMVMDNSFAHNFNFNEAFSFVVTCDTQEEIDHYWNKFSEDGKESMCGWVRDKFGVWWQVIPSILGGLMLDPLKSPRVAQEMMKMKKLDISALTE